MAKPRQSTATVLSAVWLTPRCGRPSPAAANRGILAGAIVVIVSDDESLAQELVERARSEGVELVGRGGLLTGLTKTVLETALEAELESTSATPARTAVTRSPCTPSRN
jgi:hypothetical protein